MGTTSLIHADSPESITRSYPAKLPFGSSNQHGLLELRRKRATTFRNLTPPQQSLLFEYVVRIALTFLSARSLEHRYFIDRTHVPHRLFLKVLTVSATRENEVQQLVVTFTGNTTDEGVKMMADAPTNAFVDLTFDSGSMNWACSDATETTSQVSVCPQSHMDSPIREP